MLFSLDSDKFKITNTQKNLKNKKSNINSNNESNNNNNKTSSFIASDSDNKVL